MTSRKDLCSVYTVNGFLRSRKGQFRIIVLALNAADAAAYLGYPGDAQLMRVSKDTKDWTAYTEKTAIGDIFAVPFGTHLYEEADPDEVEL